jgi:hypothetical protein
MDVSRYPMTAKAEPGSNGARAPWPHLGVAFPDADYILPLKWADDDGLQELLSYLRWLAGQMRVVVVDGSPSRVFAAHAAAFQGLALHMPPAGAAPCVNGKVRGVHAGMAHATGQRVVIADDDVRYDATSLAAVLALLEDHDLVIPQNVFEPMPWHAKWDTARSLINRALGGDYPGTLAIRLRCFQQMGGYDGDVLFENLELIRTVRAHGGRVGNAMGVYVDRRPPSAAHFRSQRVRQAYDDLAQPIRLAVELALLPAMAGSVALRRPIWLCAALAAPVALAEVGRRRASGAARLPVGAVAFAPLWVGERAVCVWIALWARLRSGGVLYAGTRMRTAAHSIRWIRAHRAAR